MASVKLTKDLGKLVRDFSRFTGRLIISRDVHQGRVFDGFGGNPVSQQLFNRIIVGGDPVLPVPALGQFQVDHHPAQAG